MNHKTLDPQVKDNLIRLSRYLKSLPPETKSFDMGTYCFRRSNDSKCPSAACAIGHYAVMEGWEAKNRGAVPPPHLEGKVGETLEGAIPWVQFANEVIGVPYRKGDRHLGDWIFSSEWSDVDNSALGAAARIDYYLEHGIPEKFLMSNSTSKYNYSMVEEYRKSKEAIEAEQAALPSYLELFYSK